MEAEDAEKAMEHRNGFELAGKDMKVGNMTEQHQSTSLDQDDERAGFNLGATGGLAMMAKLAEGTGMKSGAQEDEEKERDKLRYGGQDNLEALRSGCISALVTQLNLCPPSLSNLSSSNNISTTASFRLPSLSTAKTTANPPGAYMVTASSPVKTISSSSMSGEKERDFGISVFRQNKEELDIALVKQEENLNKPEEKVKKIIADKLIEQFGKVLQ